MRQFKRKQSERRPLKLIRGSDGRLRSATVDDDIGDIWAEQRRIRLQEAIAEDRRRADKVAARKERWRKLREGRSVKVRLAVPKVALPKKIKKKYVVIAILVAVGGYAGVRVFLNSSDKSAANGSLTSQTLGATDKAPRYQTVLPAGKTIGELGGWARVSPPGKEPVFAYADMVDGVQIKVSQQPLPETLKKNTPEELEKLAEQFTANEKITAGDLTAYLGTSIKGPQSVVLAKGDLLILIKSDAKLANEQWADYIKALQ